MTEEQLYKTALDSPVTHAATDWLFKAVLISNIAGDDLDAAKNVIHTPEGLEAAHAEFDELTEAERFALGKYVGAHWANCLRSAIGRLWHACGILDVDRDQLDPDHVALHAATLLNEPEMVPNVKPLDEAA